MSLLTFCLVLSNVILTLGLVGLMFRCYSLQSREQRKKEQDAVASSPNLVENKRQKFLERLEKVMKKAEKNRENLAFLYVDLDNFKQFNDALGYDFGDLLLEQSWSSLAKLDWPDKLVERLSGDDFVLVLPNFKSEKQLREVTDWIAAQFGQGFTINTHEVSVSVSIGIGIFPNDATEPVALLKASNIAMYQAKFMGRNHVEFYTPDMNHQALKRQSLESYLRKAIERDELLLYYQPKIDLKTGKIAGAEALIRWRHPELGIISPIEFISLAEQTGLVIPMGNWIVKTACLQTKQWHAAGFTGFTIAVNLSAYQFKQGDIGSAIAEVLWDTGLEPSLLELEITESLVMENPEKSQLILRVLRTMGIQISIDDFGTGYSSLGQLRNLPFQSLKIDQSFVHNLESEPDNRAIISTIISMAKRLHLKTVAEGVETEEQKEYLISEGCDYAQGYLFSRPVVAAELSVLLEQEKRGS